MTIREHASVPWDRGYYSKVWLRRLFDARAGASSYILLEQVIPPGGYITAHSHDFDEVLTFLTGTVHVRVGADVAEMHAESSVLVAKGTVHEVENRAGTSARLLAFSATADPAIRYPDGPPSPVVWSGSDEAWEPGRLMRVAAIGD
jgi:quercetin dioxygenase-like cupin family protein